MVNYGKSKKDDDYHRRHKKAADGKICTIFYHRRPTDMAADGKWRKILHKSEGQKTDFRAFFQLQTHCKITKTYTILLDTVNKVIF